MKRKHLQDAIDRRAEHAGRGLMIAKVDKVYEKESNDPGEGNVEVDIVTKAAAGSSAGPSRIHKIERVPIISHDHTGHAYVPREGEHVVVDWMKGEHKQPAVVAVTQTDEHRAPNILEGHWRHEFRRYDSNGDIEDELLYLEAVPDAEDIPGGPSLLRMGVKPDGLAEPTTEVAVDDRGAETEVRVETDGHVRIETTDEGSIELVSDADVNITSTSGNVDVTAQNGDVSVDASNLLELDGDQVVINTDEGPTTVAKADHTHEYELEDNYFQNLDPEDIQEYATSEPNEDGTQTEIG